MDEFCRNKRVFSIKDERVELIYGRVEVPYAEESERSKAKLFNDYYLKIAGCAEEWAGKYAKDVIKKEYESLDLHDRKFCFRRYEYYISFKTEDIDDTNISITVSFDLMRCRKLLKHKEKNDVWDRKLLLMKNTSRKRGNK